MEILGEDWTILNLAYNMQLQHHGEKSFYVPA